MKYEEGYCQYCDGRFVGRGPTEGMAGQHLQQQLDDHEPQCLMRPENQGRKKKRR